VTTNKYTNRNKNKYKNKNSDQWTKQEQEEEQEEEQEDEQERVQEQLHEEVHEQEQKQEQWPVNEARTRRGTRDDHIPITEMSQHTPITKLRKLYCWPHIDHWSYMQFPPEN